MKRKQKRFMKKLLVLFAIASILVLNLASYASASLAEVSLFKNVNVDAELGGVEGTDPYTLSLGLQGSSLLSLELVNPDKTVVFYADELHDLWNTTDKTTAHVTSEMLPISLADIPGLAEALGGVTGTVTDTVTDTLTLLETTLNDLSLGLLGEGGLINVVGKDGILTDVTGLAANLADTLETELLAELNKVFVYDEDVVVTKGANGELVISFSDALGKRIEGLVKNVVLDVVGDLVTTIGELDIDVNTGVVGTLPIVSQLPILGGLLGTVGNILDGVVDPILDDLVGESGLLLGAVKETLVGTVNSLPVGQILDAVLGILNNISLEVLGDLDVQIDNISIEKPSGLNGEVKVYGAAVNTGAISLDLLGSLVDFDTISFNEKAPTTPTTPDGDDGGTKLPVTSAGILSYGLLGLGTLVAGVGTRFYAKRK